MNAFRKITLEKIFNNSTIITTPQPVKTAGKLTQFVQQQLDSSSSSFKEKFLSLPPGPEREQLVYDEVTKRNIKANLVPVTVEGPNGIKITYKTMPDYITIDGIRVPMAGKTAQKIADHFKMLLPTSKMDKQIWEAADIKFRPTPLSSGGYKDQSGKHYSPKEVVQSRIGASDAAVAYSSMIQQELANKDTKNKLLGGHMKSIIQPERDSSKLGLFGWYGESGDPLEPSVQTKHDTSVHAEYGAGTRLIDEKVTVTLPNGKVINTSMDKVLSHPQLYQLVSNVQGKKSY